VTRHLNDLLDRYIEADAYQTKSEFVRTAVRDRLRMELAKMEVEASAIA
jgi:Arc/MetJ-type ribon-helix-helix transcriptional regulator